MDPNGKMRTIDVDGMSIRYTISGLTDTENKRANIFVNGYGVAIRRYPNILGRLAKREPTFGVELFGMEYDGIPRTMKEYASVLKNVVSTIQEQYNIERVALFGHSAGASGAELVGREHDSCDYIVAISPILRSGGMFGILTGGILNQARYLRKRSIREAGEYVTDLMVPFVTNIGTNPVASIRFLTDAGSMGIEYLQCPQKNPPPLLLISGGRDDLFHLNPGDAEWIRMNRPNATIVALPDFTHEGASEAAQEVMDEHDKWIEKYGHLKKYLDVYETVS
ncbi:MAG: alpha/beta hydrolase [Candidatus Aenigmarchaeota archaeon]|nr:alpha/beta hydrolase [Candidatus Aenigmarchaeota archaeon]